MSLFDALAMLASPGPAIGCALGILAAFGLHWAFPSEDLAVVQALLIVLGCFLGTIVNAGPRSPGPKE